MTVAWDYRCTRCNVTVERRTDDAHKDSQRHYPCGQMMTRLPAAPAFSVTGYNAKNGYSK